MLESGSVEKVVEWCSVLSYLGVQRGRKTPTAPLRGGGGWIVPFVATFQNLAFEERGSQRHKHNV